MIGFREQDVTRRPIYSITGAKLGYLVSGPDGEWWTNLHGRRIGRIKKIKRKAADATASVSGNYIGTSDIDW